MILNGSPRAPRSNSKRYASVFLKYCPSDAEYFNISAGNHAELRSRIEECSDILFVFPLYADSLPVGLVRFLKYLEANPPAARPVVSILVNCGFLEYTQNEIAVRMMRLFCRQNGYPFGSVLMIGSGEAIMDFPFKVLVIREIKRLAESISEGNHRVLHVTMPIGKHLFRIAATYYWIFYGRRFGVTRRQMQTMKIE